MSEGSRVPGFYKLSIAERRALIADRTGVAMDELTDAVATGGLDAGRADKVVENVLGVYGLPFGVILNVVVNGTDRLVPAVVEEPSVIAAASNAARMVRAAGGFTAEVPDPQMIGQIHLFEVPDLDAARAKIDAARAELLESARGAVPGLVARGGGPRGIEVRPLDEHDLVLHVLVDCKDAMGANLVNSVAEAVGPRAAELSGGRLGLRILSNLCDRRLVRVRCRAHARDLVGGTDSIRPPGATSPEQSGTAVVDAIVGASRFAELDPYRAATHNKGIMNGVDAVVLATGNDFRAVEAGAHAYAARSGRYSPLATWRRDGDDLVGELEMPLALGTVGGTLRVHPVARLALAMLQTESAAELCQIAAAVGLASNLAALRALATEGIQRGHMSLHARSVAAAAGAEGDDVERVAAALAESGDVTLEHAKRLVARGRNEDR